MNASEASPDDMTYWVQPPAAPEFLNVEPKKRKKGEKKPRFRTTTVPPNADFAMIDIRPLFNAEMNKGKPTGPLLVKGWPKDVDPRFSDPVNPLYDPLAVRGTDWRSKLDIVSYLRFADYVAHIQGMMYRYVIESQEDENIFNEKVMNQIRGIKVKDSVTDATASDASDQANDSCNNSSSLRKSEVTTPAETARPKSTDKAEPKRHTGTVVKHNTLTGATTVISPAVDQHGSKKLATNGDFGKDGKETTSPVDKQSTELLRMCARCDKQESTLHEFKKCKKCKELNVKEAKYYCGRECQTVDWSDRHRQEHRDWQRSLASAAPSDN